MPFGLICSPFLLAGTIHHHLTTITSPLGSNLLRNTYVDNVFHGVESVNDGKDFFTYSKRLFQEAGMNLRAFVSNSKELNDFFGTQEGNEVNPAQKLLGLHWNTSTDEISISFGKPSPSTHWTKRKVLKEVASIYDPLGLASPTTLYGKLFLQSLWKIQLGWDELLPPDLNAKWSRIIDSWNIPWLKMKRLLFTTDSNDSDTTDLHVFTDASTNAYCAAAYLVRHGKNSLNKVSIIMAKSRLAPLNQSITIPRLELSALAIGAKLITYITQQLPIPVAKKFLWTDSTVALAWSKGDKQVPIFVRNRVKTIQEHTSNVSIRYVPTDDNPADIGTRGATISELQTQSQWWYGPPFLSGDETKWPPSPTPSVTINALDDKDDFCMKHRRKIFNRLQARRLLSSNQQDSAGGPLFSTQ